jgi:hypothetical protein
LIAKNRLDAERAVPALLRATTDSDAEVRHLAFRILEERATGESSGAPLGADVARAARDALEDESLAVRLCAAILLARSGDRAGARVIVEAVSRSRFWPETAIFIIEDDAQNGPDHVDAHRTVGFVISPYVKRNALDSTMYTTASMVRTMELILGLPHMTQFDELATPMYNSFTSEPDLAVVAALPAEVDLEATNPKGTAGDRASRKLDFSDVDRADQMS